MAKFIGVDVSFWKDFPDWSRVSDIDFAIMGVTERNGIDASFYHNYDGCKSNGIKIGAYKYSYARNGEESRAEAEKVIRTLDGRKLDFPIFLDLEWDVQTFYTSSKLMEIISEFKKVIIDAGYMFGIYCNKHWYESIIPQEAKENEQFWIASVPYNDTGSLVESLKPTYLNVVGWQYSWNGFVDGIGGGVDMDLFYTDYSDKESSLIEGIGDIPVMPTVHFPLLQLWSSGDFVSLLQAALNVTGEELLVDGVFGENTLEAVVAFQIANSLEPDGIVGPFTWGALFEETNGKESVDELAYEVICGIFGNQPDREKLFKEAGYDNYDEVQKRVNELL